jgi:HD-like signal output (HDOD) protein
LGARVDQALRDDLFLAAVTHDVGHLVLCQYFGERYGRLTIEGPQPPIALERHQLGVDHAETGAALLGEWRMPDRVIELVRWHHEPDRYPGTASDIAYLDLAETICSWKDLRVVLAEGTAGDAVRERVADHLEQIGWSWQQLGTRAAELEEARRSVDLLIDR